MCHLKLEFYLYNTYGEPILVCYCKLLKDICFMEGKEIKGFHVSICVENKEYFTYYFIHWTQLQWKVTTWEN